MLNKNWKQENVILHPHVRRVACDDVTNSRALLNKITFLLLGSGRKYSIQIVKHVLLQHLKTVDRCQFQLYDIIKFKFLHYRQWEIPVVKCDDLQFGHNETISIDLKNTSYLFIFDVFDADF